MWKHTFWIKSHYFSSATHWFCMEINMSTERKIKVFIWFYSPIIQANKFTLLDLCGRKQSKLNTVALVFPSFFHKITFYEVSRSDWRVRHKKSELTAWIRLDYQSLELNSILQNHMPPASRQCWDFMYFPTNHKLVFFSIISSDKCLNKIIYCVAM